MARPTIYTEELANDICTRIANGESVRSIGRDEKMPVASTIFAWALNNDDFSEQYVRAKEIGNEQAVEEMEDIAWNVDDVQRAKLIVDTRKWIASKKFPKKYADRSYQDLTSDGKELKTINVVKSSEHQPDSQTDGSVGSV